eukprot:6350335-Amphidinium_carterae.1
MEPSDDEEQRQADTQDAARRLEEASLPLCHQRSKGERMRLHDGVILRGHQNCCNRYPPVAERGFFCCSACDQWLCTSRLRVETRAHRRIRLFCKDFKY